MGGLLLDVRGLKIEQKLSTPQGEHFFHCMLKLFMSNVCEAMVENSEFVLHAWNAVFNRLIRAVITVLLAGVIWFWMNLKSVGMVVLCP